MLELRAIPLFQRSNGTANSPLLGAVRSALRDTDFIGWKETGTCLGVICAETGSCDGETAGQAVTKRLRKSIEDALPAGTRADLQLTFQSSTHPSEPDETKPETVLAGECELEILSC
ncbi:MAG: hypothetical protein ABIR70_14585 [Bryobacteraceae bacterium]